ncbi:MAG: T9SS type A sorting domain-containing protein [Bacteroidetes bacterium]|nr:T9SS type A sorting domain-containing protein [Fibrella sp.]
MKKLFLPALLIFPLFGQAQPGTGSFSFQYDQTPAVTVNNRVLPNAWAGGLNSSQFQTMKLNDDAADDLVVFDRTSNKVNTFLWQNGAWQYAPEYELRFPAINNWMVLADYDGDGRKDLFAHGLVVYRNTRGSEGQLVWQKVVDPLLHVGLSSSLPQYLYVANSDIPAIVDYDGDGDLDILAFDVSGDGVVYYQNMSREKGSGGAPAPPGLDYKRSGQCWGGFSKQECNDFQFGITCDAPNGRVGSPNARVQHSGNTLTVLDTDGDGMNDILFGFVSCANIARLRSVGPNNASATYVSADTAFPARNPINFNSFPATFYEDVDGDGIKDLLASPNMSANDVTRVDFRNSNWFYKNTGTTARPNFQYVNASFLQADMLDLGEYAAPALSDLDGDGDADLLVGYGGVLGDGADYRGSIWHFENTGTTTAPAFRLVTTDYLNLAKTLSLTNLIPAFTDVNADGSPDLVVTGTAGTTPQIRVLLNGAAKGAVVKYDLSTARILPLPDRFGPGDKPVFVDVDRDGKPDLLIGKVIGSIEYYRNVGTATSPAYQLQNQSFGGIAANENTQRQSPSIAVADFNADGRAELFTATANGQLKLYRMPDAPDGPLTLIDSLPALGLAGGGLVAVAADLTGDNLPDLLLGTGSGGLRYLRNTSPKAIVTAVAELAAAWAYPNPTTGLVTVVAPFAGRVEVFSVTGRAMVPDRAAAMGVETLLDLSALPGGVYLVRLTANNGVVKTRKVVVWR